MSERSAPSNKTTDDRSHREVPFTTDGVPTFLKFIRLRRRPASASRQFLPIPTSAYYDNFSDFIPSRFVIFDTISKPFHQSLRVRWI